MPLLRDDDISVREEVCQSIIKLGGSLRDRVYEPLFSAASDSLRLKTDQSTERRPRDGGDSGFAYELPLGTLREIWKFLTEIGPSRQVVGAPASKLGDTNPAIRRRAAQILNDRVTHWAQPAVATLKERLSDDDPLVGPAVVAALGWLLRDRPVELILALEPLFKDGTGGVVGEDDLDVTVQEVSVLDSTISRVLTELRSSPESSIDRQVGGALVERLIGFVADGGPKSEWALLGFRRSQPSRHLSKLDRSRSARSSRSLSTVVVKRENS